MMVGAKHTKRKYSPSPRLLMAAAETATAGGSSCLASAAASTPPAPRTVETPVLPHPHSVMSQCTSSRIARQ